MYFASYRVSTHHNAHLLLARNPNSELRSPAACVSNDVKQVLRVIVQVSSTSGQCNTSIRLDARGDMYKIRTACATPLLLLSRHWYVSTRDRPCGARVVERSAQRRAKRASWSKMLETSELGSIHVGTYEQSRIQPMNHVRAQDCEQTDITAWTLEARCS
jgi:hypothetical protein